MSVDTYTETTKIDKLLKKPTSHFQLSTTQLYNKILDNNEGVLTELGAVNASTGKYTGRSPKDKFFVSEPSYRDNIDWGEINQPIDEETFLKLYHKVLDYLDKKDELYVFKGYAGSDKDTMLKLTVINELAWHNLFAKNMFIRPESKEEALEKERIQNKKTITKQQEDYNHMVSTKDRKIDALKLFSKNHSEYVTDMRLIGIRERLVKEKRIRPEDMHIMANIFLPKDGFNNIERISHLVLTRTGLYIIDSQLLKGHVYNGISGGQFKDLPPMEQVFDTLDLDKSRPQTIVMDQNDDKCSLSFVNYSDQIEAIKQLAEDLQKHLGAKYTLTSILYFNPKNEGDVTISNYNQNSAVKVLVGAEQLDEFFNKFVFHGRIQYNVEDLQQMMDKIESFN